MWCFICALYPAFFILPSFHYHCFHCPPRPWLTCIPKSLCTLQDLPQPVPLHISWDTPSVIPFLKIGTWPLCVNPTLRGHVSHPSSLLYKLKSWVCNPYPLPLNTVHDNKETPITSLTYTAEKDSTSQYVQRSFVSSWGHLYLLKLWVS